MDDQSFVPTKRKRGRPRKLMPPSPKRKRGRPRKLPIPPPTTKRRRGRPSKLVKTCAGVDLQVNFEPSPMMLPPNQDNDDKYTVPVPASNVENHALYQDSHPRKEGLDKNFSKGAALGEESQLSNIIDSSSMYGVNSMYADTLKSIFEKHGNIVMDCTMRTPTVRTSFLETICKSVQELQSKKLSEIDHDLLESCYLVVNDCEAMKFKVKWFAERLDEIRDALDSQVAYQKIIENMKHIEDRKRDLERQIFSHIKVVEHQLEDMNRSARALECKLKHFGDNHLMYGVL